MKENTLNNNMINLCEAGVTTEGYLFTIKVNKELAFHFIPTYKFSKKKKDFGMFLGSKFGLLHLNKELIIDCLQSISESRIALKNKKKHSIWKKYRYVKVYEQGDIMMKSGFELYGLAGHKSTNLKLEKGIRYLTNRTKYPSPVKIKFKHSEDFIDITEKELTKICETLKDIDRITEFFYGCKGNFIEYDYKEMGEDYLFNEERFEKGIDNYVIGFDVLQFLPSEFVEYEYGEPSFQDDVLIGITPEHPEVWKFYSIEKINEMAFKAFDIMTGKEQGYEKFREKIFEKTLINSVKKGLISDEDINAIRDAISINSQLKITLRIHCFSPAVL